MLGLATGKVWTSDKKGKVTYHELFPEPAGGAYGALYGQMLKALKSEHYYPTVRHGAADARIALAAYASAERKATIDLRNPDWVINDGAPCA